MKAVSAILLAVSAILLLAAALAGCIHDGQQPIRTETVVIEPSAALLRDCLVPGLGTEPNGDVLIGSAIKWSGRLLAALQSCNEDKAALRRFYREVGDGGE